MMNQIHRGDIYFADLGQTEGSEQRGYRPVIVIQNDIGNQFSPTVIVAPLTGRYKKMTMPTHVLLGKSYGLTEDSIALLEQIRTIDRNRLRRFIGHVDSTGLKEIDKAAAISLGISE